MYEQTELPNEKKLNQKLDKYKDFGDMASFAFSVIKLFYFAVSLGLAKDQLYDLTRLHVGEFDRDQESIALTFTYGKPKNPIEGERFKMLTYEIAIAIAFEFQTRLEPENILYRQVEGVIWKCDQYMEISRKNIARIERG